MNEMYDETGVPWGAASPKKDGATPRETPDETRPLDFLVAKVPLGAAIAQEHG